MCTVTCKKLLEQDGTYSTGYNSENNNEYNILILNLSQQKQRQINHFKVYMVKIATKTNIYNTYSTYSLSVSNTFQQYYSQ